MKYVIEIFNYLKPYLKDGLYYLYHLVTIIPSICLIGFLLYFFCEKVMKYSPQNSITLTLIISIISIFLGIFIALKFQSLIEILFKSKKSS